MEYLAELCNERCESEIASLMQGLQYTIVFCQQHYGRRRYWVFSLSEEGSNQGLCVAGASQGCALVPWWGPG